MTSLNAEKIAHENATKAKNEALNEADKASMECKAIKDDLKKFKESKSKEEAKLLETESETRKKESALACVNTKLNIASKDLKDYLAKSEKEIKAINTDKDSYMSDFQDKKKSAEKELYTVRVAKDNVSKEIDTKHSVLESLGKEQKDEMVELDKIKDLKKSMLNEVENIMSSVAQYKNDVIDQDTIKSKNKIAIKDLEDNIADLESELKSVEKDLEKAKAANGAFIQAKIVLQKDKETLTVRELYIIDKYEQAGIEYSGEQFDSTKSYILNKADLQQEKSDLDKREKFIQEKYKEAGIKYL